VSQIRQQPKTARSPEPAEAGPGNGNLKSTVKNGSNTENPSTAQSGGEDLSLVLGWLLMRPTCNLTSLHDVWELAKEFHAPIGVSLIHYSLPYFTEGPEGQLQFRPEE
jgi:hypothetical protein